MTLDEIIRMARESGIEANEDNGYLEWWNFAKLVAAHEREACAKVCDGVLGRQNGVSAAIRARGDK